MSFKLTPSPTFKFAVQIREPGGDTFRTLPLVGKHKSRKDLKAWIESAPGRADDEFLADALVGWEVVDDAGQPVPFSREALATLIDTWPTAGDDIYQAYLRELTEARKKP